MRYCIAGVHHSLAHAKRSNIAGQHLRQDSKCVAGSNACLMGLQDKLVSLRLPQGHTKSSQQAASCRASTYSGPPAPAR